MQITIAIDAMGGDHGPSVTVPAALNFLGEFTQSRVILVGRRAAIDAELARAKSRILTAAVRAHALIRGQHAGSCSFHNFGQQWAHVRIRPSRDHDPQPTAGAQTMQALCAPQMRPSLEIVA